MQTLFPPTPPDPPQMFHHDVGRWSNVGERHGRQAHMLFVRVTAVPPTPTTSLPPRTFIHN
ncbi:MAG: hypothetical protein IPL28_02930 [Chloroflexi bacterium]|nr:hypothetical protein [Chloroflexota bacterium]